MEKSQIEDPNNPDSLKSYILEIVKKQGKTESDYEQKEKEIGSENMRKVEKIIALRTLDFMWMDHLENMEYLRDSVRLRAYGQQDPLLEYKNEGHKMFRQLLDTIATNIVDTLFRVTLVKPEQAMPAKNLEFSQPSFSAPSAGQTSKQAVQKQKIGRNDPCPCGAKKPDGRPVKYKHCHGKKI